MAGDWIKVYRRIIDSEVFQDDWLTRLFVWCLCKANFCDGVYRGMPVLRGQFITGRNSGSQELHVSPSKLYRGLHRLESLGCVEIVANSNWTTVTVCRFNDYQAAATESEQPVIQPADSERTTGDTSGEHNIRTQELKKGRNKKVGVFTPPTLEEVQAYCDERSNTVDPSKFVDFYQSKNWMVGRNKMKDWQASVRTWEKSERPSGSGMFDSLKQFGEGGE